MEANEMLRRRIQESQSRGENPLAGLHYSMCKAVGGYVPLDEFMNLPLAVPFELMNMEAEVNKEVQKKVKHG